MRDYSHYTVKLKNSIPVLENYLAQGKTKKAARLCAKIIICAFNILFILIKGEK